MHEHATSRDSDSGMEWTKAYFQEISQNKLYESEVHWNADPNPNHGMLVLPFEHELQSQFEY